MHVTAVLILVFALAPTKSEDGGSEDSRHLQSREIMSGSEWSKWPKAVVPWEMQGTRDIYSIPTTIRKFEMYTCLRFPPWEKNVTRHQYGLPDEGHLRFVDGSGCWAVVSNAHSSSGQGVSCCGVGPCMHEIGHALGFGHEQGNPYRRGWIAWRGSGPRGYNTSLLLYPYDLNSIMMYDWGYEEYFPEQNSGGNDYGVYKVASETHHCVKLRCPNTTLQCAHEGFVSYMEDKECRCMCPLGLTSASQCNDVGPESSILTMTSWPPGSYSLLASKDGCPGSGLFKKTQLTLKVEGTALLSDDLDMTEENGTMTLNLCERQPGGDSSLKWPMGSYCFVKGSDDCPQYFLTTHMETEAPNSSALRMEFCCQGEHDHNLFTALPFPRTQPFAIPWFGGKQVCNSVEGMNSRQTVIGPIKAGNHSKFHPFYVDENVAKLRTCYYFPYKTNCGSVVTLTRDKTSATVTSPGYPSLDNNYECFWLVKAPNDSTIVASFVDFDLQSPDVLSLWYDYIIQPERDQPRYTGNQRFSFRSLRDMMKLRLRTHSSGLRRGFKVVFTAVLPEDLCYNTADQGRSYRGDVTFTRNFKRCLPWTQVQHCRYHPFDYVSQQAGLGDHNKCRNAGDGLRPWCYTDSKCSRDYCDACLKEPSYDQTTFCKSYARAGRCSGPKAMQQCARTCTLAEFAPGSGDSLPWPQPEYPVSCGSPDAIAGTTVATSGSSFQPGDEVQYTCDDGSGSFYRVCLEDGNWTHTPLQCGNCTAGWTLHQGACYKLIDDVVPYREAEVECGRHLALVSPAASQAEYDLLLQLRQGAMWLGLTDRDVEGTFVWSDEVPLDKAAFQMWKSGEPNDWAGSEDCGMIRSDGLWNDIECVYYKFPFVCKHKPLAPASSQMQAKPWPKPASTVKCPKPDDIADANLVTSGSSFDVGSKVTYQCKAGLYSLQRTCLSDATWSPGGYVCGGCPTGWTRHQGACYHFLYKGSLTYSEAGKACGLLGARVAPAASKKEMEFLRDLRDDQLEYFDLWLGMTDIETEGTYVWTDGTVFDNNTYHNWASDEPEDPKGSLDCVRIVDTGTWKTRGCWSTGSYLTAICKRRFNDTLPNNAGDCVCQKVKDAGVCQSDPRALAECFEFCNTLQLQEDLTLNADRLTDCGQLKKAVPDFCTKYPDFSFVYCHKTCGL